MRDPLVYTLIFCFLTFSLGPLPCRADEFVLPMPGTMVQLSPMFTPPIMKGLKVDLNNPFKFDFVVDKAGNNMADDQVREESTKLIKYFLASLTTPEEDMWVNLSPYEKSRIIPESFGQTEMGRDLLAQDYILKQITSSLTYPEGETGKKFWKRIYEEAAKKFGNTNIPVNTFNKVWIVPQEAVVYENTSIGVAYVVKGTLKVMLEGDYLAAYKNAAKGTQANETGKQIVREIVIPVLTKEVNEGKNFARLRQVYNSMILATWFKKRVKDSIFAKVYTNKNKIAGVNIDDPQEKQRIYQRYLRAFKKGVYNYIKEEQDPMSQEIIPRKYFSGGFWGGEMARTLRTTENEAMVASSLRDPNLMRINAAMISATRALRTAVTALAITAAGVTAAGVATIEAKAVRPAVATTAAAGVKAVRGLINSLPAFPGPLSSVFTGPNDYVYAGSISQTLRKVLEANEGILSKPWFDFVQASTQYQSYYQKINNEPGLMGRLNPNQKGPYRYILSGGGVLKSIRLLNDALLKLPFGRERIVVEGKFGLHKELLILVYKITHDYGNGIYSVVPVDVKKNTKALREALAVSRMLPGDRRVIIDEEKVSNEVKAIKDAISHPLLIAQFSKASPKQIRDAILNSERIYWSAYIAESNFRKDLDQTQVRILAYLKLLSQDPRPNYKFWGLSISEDPKNKVVANGILSALTGTTGVTVKELVENGQFSNKENISGKFIAGLEGIILGIKGPELRKLAKNAYDQYPGRVKKAAAVMPEENAASPVNRAMTTPKTDQAVLAEVPLAEPNIFTKGGIDLNAKIMNLEIQNMGKGIKFNIDPAMLQQLQNAPGFEPFIINIQPMKDLSLFLGIKNDLHQESAVS